MKPDLTTRLALLAMRVIFCRSCWHCHSRIADRIRNRYGLWFCIDLAGCQERRRAAGFEDDDAQRLEFGEYRMLAQRGNWLAAYTLNQIKREAEQHG
jgi:hypothetical protein